MMVTAFSQTSIFISSGVFLLLIGHTTSTKVLNMGLSIKQNRMNKRGQVETVAITIGAIVIISSLIAGGIYSEKIISKYRYVGDDRNLTLYDSAKCDLKEIPSDKMHNFETKQEALNLGYHEADCNFRQ